MCPERQLLSIYLDGELPSPWKERMEAHLVSCSECAALLGRLRGCMDMFKTPLPDRDVGAKERVWQNLSARMAHERERGFNPAKLNQRLWRRTITLPLPAAAAVAVLIIAFMVAAVRPFAPAVRQQVPEIASPNAPADYDVKDMVSVQDMSSIFQYLEQEDASNYMIIKLPESRTFTRIGEPDILKAVGYPGRSREE
jgi:anti-sigma factor RsiW